MPPLARCRPQGVDGSRVERVLELAHIATNKNTVPGDKSALVPGGLRIGTPAMTSRGFVERDFEVVAALVDRGVAITQEIKKRLGPAAKLKDFRDYLDKEVRAWTGDVSACVRGSEAVSHPFIAYTDDDSLEVSSNANIVRSGPF